MDQWQKTHPPVQETGVRSLVWEDPPCRKNNETPAPELLSSRSRAQGAMITEACAPLSLGSTTREAAAMRRPRTASREHPPICHN